MYTLYRANSVALVASSFVTTLLLQLLGIFPSILDRLQPLPVAALASDVVNSQGVSQLYLGLDFLQPLTTAAAQ